ncbi:(2Fe-2S)-binding protein [Desulfosporosinus metallidurans]|uniref:Xanthine dehydrogenase iron-sulfur subunit n=1 Tax=Desulfosporosinus metallidurans TaxID=1888891 RepID=A0A1Q8QZ86_9FIRM|nr:(2Fe-2S)-binding protein [Desulfosporosinus metallidurans]OLN32636.1 Xanthine dehydrogenase iron-sulfur subunit [Desulfosporosinus metallidurans]
MNYRIRLVVNGFDYESDVKANETLLDFLRNQLGLTGVKKGCDGGECGACVVLINGQPVNACLVLAVELDGDVVTTIEGLDDEDSRLIQEAFVAVGAVQCGFCSPGMVIATKGLLDVNSAPTQEDINQAMVGHLCRCTGYSRTVTAVQDAADRLKARRLKQTILEEEG